MQEKLQMQEQKDAQLMAGLAVGDTSLLGELYVRYYKLVRATLFNRVPEMTQADIQDVTQDVFIALGKTAGNYQEQSQFKAWLYKIIHRQSIDWRRKTWVRRKFLAKRKEPAAMAFAREKSSPENMTALRQTVSQTLSKLPGDQRETLWLHFVEGFEGDEIAKIMDVRRSTVYTRLHRARTTLLENVNADIWKDVFEEDKL